MWFINCPWSITYLQYSSFFNFKSMCEMLQDNFLQSKKMFNSTYWWTELIVLKCIKKIIKKVNSTRVRISLTDGLPPGTPLVARHLRLYNSIYYTCHVYCDWRRVHRSNHNVLFLQTLFKFLIITYLIIIINTKYAVTAMATVNCASYYRLVIYDYIIWNNTSRRAVQSEIRPQAPLLRA